MNKSHALVRLALPIASCVVALLAAAEACALQVIDAHDGVTVEALIADKEPTRIRIENAAITDVFGNLYSSNCASPTPTSGIAGTPSASNTSVNPSGEIALECDRDKGEIYVRPVGNASKPINLFISSAHATYTLLLRRADKPADTIIISDKSIHKIVGDTAPEHQGSLGPSANHVRAMKTLLIAMATDRLLSDVRMEEINRPLQLWKEARFAMLRSYEGHGLVGEKYTLTNTSDQTMVLAEQEFDRPDGNVVGVAIENQNLRPGESTQVYVIRLGGGS